MAGVTVPAEDCVRFAIADTAVSDKRTADYTVIGMFALTPKGDLLLLERWRQKLEIDDNRMAMVCRAVRSDNDLASVYQTLEAWLHEPTTDVGADEFLQRYREVQ